MSVELEKLAGLINEKASARWQAISDDTHLMILNPNGAGLCGFCPWIKHDISHAKFIIWSLDLLQELWDGHWTRRIGSSIEYSVDLIGNSATGEGFFIEVTVYPENDSHAVAHTYPVGCSRAECCANALYAALTSLSEEENKSNG